MHRFRRYFSTALLVLLASHAGSVAATNDRVVAAGDIVTGLLPIATFAVPYFKDDTLGMKEWLRDTVVNEVLNTGLRVAFNSTSLGRRPNGGKYGFPSGHAGFVFSQATFLLNRYGWTYGGPALAVAAGVSYIRVREDKHHWRDIIAGGVLAYGVTLLTVTPEKATHLAPVIGPDFIGLRWERSF